MKTTIRIMAAGSLLVSLALIVTGCNKGDLSDLEWGNPNGPGGKDGPGGVNGTNDPAATLTPIQTCESVAKKYVGFGKTDLNATREEALAGVDRVRFKPYSALTGEYPRVTGQTPQLLTQSGTTFGQPVARWNQEPQASAVNVYTAYRVAFESCLALTATDAKYAAAPAEPVASGECSAFARRAWSRTATADEVKACVQVATVDTSTETDVRRRWAYTCASVLSSAGFLTY